MPVSLNPSEKRSMEVSRVLGIALAEAAYLPFGEAKQRMLRGARQAAARVATNRERLEVRRRAAESLLMVACSRNEPWFSVRTSYASVEALGFTDADRCVQVAALLARWCLDHNEQLALALQEITRARRRAARLRRDGALRTRLMTQADEVARALSAMAAGK